MEQRSPHLDAIFKPRTVAVVGASDNPGKLGFHVMKSLVEGGYPGAVFPINPGKNEILGLKAYPSLSHAPQTVDLAIVVLPAPSVAATLKECEQKGVKGVVLITAGFKEIEDKGGEVLQNEIRELADQFGIKIIGPNTFGVVNLHLPLNASFTPEFSQVKKGTISLVSQSGGMSHLLGFLAIESRVGMSKIIGLGNRCNVDFAESVAYLSQDPETEVIAMYIEGIDEPRGLIDVAKQSSLKKPLVAFKAGRSLTSDKASQFHTGSLAGKHEIYTGAFRQGGILMVESSEELLDASKALAMCPLPQGAGVAVLSGQAGPGMVASDLCEGEGMTLPPFSAAVQRRIDELLPPIAIRTNPVDMGPAWYDSAAIEGIVDAACEDPAIHAIVLCIMFASANRSAVGTLAQLLRKKKTDKPILSCFSAPGATWKEEIGLLEGTGIPNFPTPERAAKALVNLIRYHRLREKRKAYGNP